MARRRAAVQFRAYLRRNPTVAAIYKEEKRRETVHVARRNAILSFSAAVLSFGVAVKNPVAAPGGMIALLQSETQVQNFSSKLMKARGNTMGRARALAKKDASIERPDIRGWLAAGLVREGDVPSYSSGRRHKRSRKK